MIPLLVVWLVALLLRDLILGLLGFPLLTFRVFIAESYNLILEIGSIQLVYQVVIWTSCLHHSLILFLLLSEMIWHMLLRDWQCWINSLHVL